MLLEVRGLTVRFALPAGELIAVDDVSYRLAAGRTLGVVGESGSGKTVTALALLGLLPPNCGVTDGAVLWLGTDLVGLDTAALRALRGRHISMIFQDPLSALNPAMTVGAQVAESLALHEGLGRAAARDQAVAWLARVGLQDPRRQAEFYPHELSGGMRQRATIAMALACGPELLIADEPTTALDVTVQARILDLLLDLQAELGLALQFISHNLAVVSEVADDIAVMYAGAIVEIGPAQVLFDTPHHPYTRALLAALPRPGLRRPPEPIAGAVPSLTERADGCLYADRCPLVMPACRLARPYLTDIGNGRSTACIRSGEMSS
ncbi:MAG: ABC transporter ATP-binding protein [Proteobacteria bacterium]|nr:ABC transporter ATP-binding protein [Pseudomonadota bacterium]